VFTGKDEAAGATVIDVRLAAALVTFNVAMPLMELAWAVMVTVPEFEPVACPEESTLAMVESEELHCAVLVTS